MERELAMEGRATADDIFWVRNIKTEAEPLPHIKITFGVEDTDGDSIENPQLDGQGIT